MTPDSRPGPGSQFGPYRIEAAIGKGGMGEVWKAHDSRLNRDVAIKIGAQQFSGRFEREARAIAALNHPNICTLYDIGPNYLVMEFIAGAPLAGPLPLNVLLNYAGQICDALDTAHRAGIVHRDLKPGNILVSNERIKLLDFGLAQVQPGPGDPTITQLTRVGAVMGTPAYMAPEQWEGKQADTRSDIYSFGCILYELLTGERTAGRLASPIRLSPGVPPELGRIISKCLEIDPDLRYQHAADIRADLRRLQRDIDTRSAPPKRRTTLAVAAAATLLVTGYFLAPLLHSKPKLTDKDTIVLADFTNNTHDPVFDGTLRQGLAVQLEQSPFLSIISDDRIQRTLSMMTRPADTPLTPEVGREICVRTGSAAVLDGSIASLGNQYVLGLRAKACGSGAILDEEQVQAARKEDVLNALTDIASKFRTRVGESLSTIQKHNTPLAEATTQSLEALKAYSQGLKVLASSGDDAAARFFKRATEIDPQFAMAQARLGLSAMTVGESAFGVEHLTAAFQLRNRASDAERFFIDAVYDLQVTGNLERAQQTCQEWAQNYPRENDAHGLLSAMVYVVLGKYPEALDEAQKNLAIDPDFAIAYLQIAFNNTFLGHLDKSDQALNEAAARHLEIPELSTQRYFNAFLEGDIAGMERETSRSAGNGDTEDWLSALEAFTLAYSGHLRQAEIQSQHAVDLARQGGRKDRAALLETGPAVIAALFGNETEGSRLAKAALSLSYSRDVEYGAAFALTLAGNSSEAQRIAGDLAKRYPDDTAVKFNYLPSLNALLLLKTDPARAVSVLQSAAACELGTPPSSAFAFFGNLYPVYVRGLAFLAARDGAGAAAEFRKILANRNIVANDPIGALAHLQLGRALVMAKDTAGAKAAYQDFLTLWKDADPGIPVLQQAQAESATLQ
jgi:serine/threonine protein kinase/tetratricopeptide (TPR) repeat protein